MIYILAMLLFYQDYTGESYADKIGREYGKTITVEYCVHPEHSQLQNGDITGDNKVDSDDLWRYDELTGEAWGFTVNGIVAHPDPNCYNLQRSSRVKELKKCERICLPCAARKAREE